MNKGYSVSKCKNCGKDIMYSSKIQGWVHKDKVWGAGSSYGHPLYNDGTYCYESKITKAGPYDE